MRLLLSGATGFIGRRLFPKLLSLRHEVVAIIRNREDATWLSAAGCACIVADKDWVNLRDATLSLKPDGVVHLASTFLARHEFLDIHPLLISNVVFPTHLIDIAAGAGARWFLNTGTIWEHFNNELYNPVNLYAATKKAFEDVSRYYVESSSMAYMTLELSDTYGVGDTRPKLLNLWRDMNPMSPPMKMSPGDQLISLVHVDDVVNAFGHAIGLLEGTPQDHNLKSYAVTSIEPIQLRDLAAKFEQSAQKPLNIRWGQLPHRTREMMTPPSISPRLPGWVPRISLEQGLRDFCGSGTQNRETP